MLQSVISWKREFLRHASLAYLYPFIFLGMCLVTLPAINVAREISAQQTAYAEAQVPTRSLGELEQEYDALRVFLATASESSANYFEFIARRYALEATLSKYSNNMSRSTLSGEETNKFLRLNSGIDGLSRATTALQQDTVAKVGAEDHRAYALQWQKKHPYNGHPYSKARAESGITYAAFWPVAWDVYLNSMLLMAMFFVIRTHREELLVSVEVWRLPLAAVLWPAALAFRYPARIDPQQQMREALLALTYAFSALISFGAMGGVAKAGEKGAGKRGGESAFITNAEAHAALKLMPLSTDSTGYWYVSPEYTAKLNTRALTLSASGFAEIGKKGLLLTKHALGITPPKGVRANGFREQLRLE